MGECHEVGYFVCGFIVACVMGTLWILVEGFKEAEKVKQRRKQEIISKENTL